MGIVPPGGFPNLPGSGSSLPYGPGDEFEIGGAFVSTDLKTVSWREEQFTKLGLPDIRAKLIAPLLAPDGGYKVDLCRFRLLVKSGCDPLLALDILE